MNANDRLALGILVVMVSSIAGNIWFAVFVEMPKHRCECMAAGQ